MTTTSDNRGTWGSKIGFILAASGSAVGLGAIWKFPYIAGQNGGGVFLLVYLACVFTVGIVMMLSEMMIGRTTKKSATSAYKELGGKHWRMAGWIGVACVFLILGFYSVVGGWTIAYIVEAFQGDILITDGAELEKAFGDFIGTPFSSISYTFIFLFFTAAIVIAGVQSGIERICKVLMPALFILMLFLAIRTLTLPGAMDGLVYLVTPDWSKLSVRMVLDALGLAVFSLSVGAGLMLAYGSYLPKETRIVNSGLWIGLLAIIAAVLAGTMILPAVFAFGVDPAAGPGLTFITMPALFAQMAGGQIFAVLFFFLLLFAAITSSISILEPAVAFLIDEFGIRRKVATFAVATANFLVLGIPAALSNGQYVEHMMLFGKSPFDLMDFIASNILMPLGGMLAAVFVGWKAWPRIRNILDDECPPWCVHLFRFIAGVLSPALIAAVTYFLIFG
ncbi:MULTISPECIES: sodium-dependent transporter [Gammaproteobacteria]|uniref:sodium-dependent transporter n=1 Tax=Gammaproteobacteria TaxID=1236 RepID=UPI000DCFDCB6|nr:MULTISPECIES: sodium-dependent transporter [Gammaproteobacteria]RTE85738.1 sodium-dependent transporter [Aliidiomarina sp. B3213]TCZ90260.1 sodium-dependent transporter [Lysobacter sp. N42]